MSLINDALKRARQAQQRPALVPHSHSTPTPLQPVESLRRKRPQSWLLLIPCLLFFLSASALWIVWKDQRPGPVEALTAPAQQIQPVVSVAPLTNALTLASARMAKWQARQEAQDLALQEGTNSAAVESRPALPSHPEASPLQLQSQPPAMTSISSTATSHSVPQPGSATAPVAAPASSTSAASTTPQITPHLATSAADVPQASAANSSVAAARPATHVAPPISPALTEPKLQGIFYRLRRPTALLDGRIVSVGDDVNGYRVARIERDTVKLANAGRVISLTLP